MNKIKLLYDVVTTMKEKEALKGTINIEAKKDQDKLFAFASEFEKDVPAGRMKAKLSTEMDCDGKKVKHESNTEFDMQGCDKGMHHGMLGRMHGHDHHKHWHGHHDMKCCGMKGKLSKLAFALHMLNSLQVEEKGDAGYALTLELNELPEELKKLMQEKKQSMEQGAGTEQEASCCGHGHFGFMKELHEMENPKVQVNAQVSKQYVVEKLFITVTGEKKGENGEVNEMNVRAEMNLIW